MKKLVYSLMAAGLAFAACTDFDEEKSEVFNDAEATVSVDIKAVDDYTVEISVTPGQTATRYAYAMVEGQYAAEDITEDDVLDMTSGILDSKKVPSVSKKVDGLNPNTPYTVFAIAYSEHNHAGKVAAKSVVTSDKLAPEFKESKASASGIILTFSEDIVLADASKVSAAVYNKGSRNYFDSEVTVKVAGNQALVSAKDAKPGSTVFVSWEEGAFVDNVGLPIEAQESGINDKGFVYGVYGQIPNEAFDIAVDTVVVESASGMLRGDAKFVFVTSKDCPKLYGNKLTATVTISNSTITSTIKTEVMVEEDNNFSVMLPKSAVAGQSVSIVIEANSFVDECGNSSKELKCNQNFIVDEDHPLATILHTYKASADSYFGDHFDWDIVIMKDDEDVNKVWIDNLEPYFAANGYKQHVYGIVTSVDGEPVKISVPARQALGYKDGTIEVFSEADPDSEEAYLLDSSENLEILVEENGRKLTILNAYGAFVDGWYNLLYGNMVITY